MYAANMGGEMKYPLHGWNSGSGGYVPQQPRFSSHDTRSFVPDGTITAPSSGAYSQAQHHHPPSQQRQHQSHPITPTELVYPHDNGSYSLSGPVSVSVPGTGVMSLHDMPSRGWVPTPPHSAPPHVGEFPGGPYHEQEAWGVHGT